VKDRKRGAESKAEIAAKERRRVAAVFFLAVSLFLAAIVYFSFTSSNQPQNLPFQLKAAIVDHLSLSFPNRTFVETATNMLEQAGYVVDYYPSKNVTVDFYRNLPAYGYKIILLRVHSAIAVASERQEVALFTSEVYSQSEYTLDQLYNRLGTATIHNPPDPGETAYFAIRSLFIKDSMRGNFNETTIIMMGCYGLKYTSMAEAFIEKGAKVYIGWEGLESADHSDEATVNLLKHLILQKQAVGAAVENTITEVGKDPYYNSTLLFYPPASAGKTIVSNNGSITSSVLSACIQESAVEPVSMSTRVLRYDR
jgi:hypothetical protein